MSLDPTLRARIDTLLATNRVVLFMKGSPDAPQCGFSARAVAALAPLGIDYASVDVLADPEIREGIKVYGDWPTIPQLYIDGDLVGGSDIVVEMFETGELHDLLGAERPAEAQAAPEPTPGAQPLGIENRLG